MSVLPCCFLRYWKYSGRTLLCRQISWCGGRKLRDDVERLPLALDLERQPRAGRLALHRSHEIIRFFHRDACGGAYDIPFADARRLGNAALFNRLDAYAVADGFDPDAQARPPRRINCCAIRRHAEHRIGVARREPAAVAAALPRQKPCDVRHAEILELVRDTEAPRRMTGAKNRDNERLGLTRAGSCDALRHGAIPDLLAFDKAKERRIVAVDFLGFADWVI